MHTNLRIAQQKPSFNTTALLPELRAASAVSVEEPRFDDVWRFATSAICSPTQSQLKPRLFLCLLLLPSSHSIAIRKPTSSDIPMANLSQSML
ncbi:hypothetical protein CGRA01v4_03158 [Colletotrichum graminicola]|uniref:Uncharacterized protein n=1 Tax=Colletotrichum graminicola (strain M1.001 / M2 / FGSC 10212) TaxID=645133 RepID=E3QB86_COLGM|nr:uncharacterized protein GLRG_03268 [Colletotrichum graminicola M1.001]EFQ28124.1 hypothetical protein GLRG_03268 [Colletotrichum graminicola M1.001]WDK11879.1 hypothetical protein CGRA01v4_03158 [Colletotrichum graminicola]